MARHEATSGRLEYAVELLALAKHDVRSNPDVRIIVNPLLDELRSELPEDMFAAAVARGKTLEMEIVVEELLAADEAEVSEGIGRDQARSSLNDLLSARELEILRLVAQGHSNRQIAAELCLALGTVKTHLHNLCGKLDAQNRTQAVARARELDLLLPRK
jgi:ATP/maltotriose-dependent transcriptional regulator MalT